MFIGIFILPNLRKPVIKLLDHQGTRQLLDYCTWVLTLSLKQGSPEYFEHQGLLTRSLLVRCFLASKTSCENKTNYDKPEARDLAHKFDISTAFLKNPTNPPSVVKSILKYNCCRLTSCSWDSWFNSQFPLSLGRLWGTSTDTWLKHMRFIGGLQPFIRIVSPFVPARSQSKVLGDIQTDQHRLYKYLDILMLHTKIWRFSMGFSWFPGLSFSGWTVAILWQLQ